MHGQARHRQPGGQHAQALVEGGQFAQQRLERRLPQAPLVGTRWALEGLQSVQQQQGAAVRHQVRQPLAFLPSRAERRVGIAKPA